MLVVARLNYKLHTNVYEVSQTFKCLFFAKIRTLNAKIAGMCNSNDSSQTQNNKSRTG